MTEETKKPEAKASQKGKRKSKPRRTNKDVLVLCVQAIRDAKDEMEILYNWLEGDHEGCPKTIVQARRLINDELRPKLSNLMMIEHQLTKGRKDIQIGNRCLDGVDWRLEEVREYLQYLEKVSHSDAGYECPQGFVDSVNGSIEYKISILEEAIESLKEVFGGQGWND